MTLLTDLYSNNNVVRNIIENGDTTHSPSGDTIFNALAEKVSTSRTINGLPLTSDINITISDVKNIETTEALIAGDLVNIYDNYGVKCRKAYAGYYGLEAHGFVLTSVNYGVPAAVYTIGTNTQVSGLLVGIQYLSSTIPGKCTSIPPSGSGIVLQKVGFATSSTSLILKIETPIVLAS